MAFTPLAQAPGANQDLLRQAMMRQMLTAQAPQNMPEAMTEIGRVIGLMLAQRGAAGRDEATNQAALDVLSGKPGDVGGGTGFAGSPELAGQTNLASPGAMPEMSRQEIEAILVADPGMREPLLRMAVERRIPQTPEPISPWQQAQLEQDDRQFQAGQQLTREEMAADQAFRTASLAKEDKGKPFEVAKFKMDLRRAAGDRPEVKGYQALAAAVTSANEAAGRDTRAADTNIIYATAKVFDPEGSVREGDQVVVTNSAALPERVLGLINYVNGGGRLTAPQRQELLAEVNSRARVWNENALAAVRDVGQEGVEAGVLASPDDLIRLPKIGPMAAPPPEQPAAETARGVIGDIRSTVEGALGLGEAEASVPPPAATPAAASPQLDFTTEIEASRKRIEDLKRKLGR